MHRVLRKGGQAQIMVYYRNVWSYYFIAGLIAGIFRGHLFKTKSFHKTSQMTTDGALARFYNIPEWTALVCDYFQIKDAHVLGSKSGLMPLPNGPLKNGLMAIMPNQVSRFLNRKLKFGNLLFSSLEKIDDPQPANR